MGGGFDLVRVGNTKMIRSVPLELNRDHEVVLSIAERKGFVTVADLLTGERWSPERMNVVLVCRAGFALSVTHAASRCLSLPRSQLDPNISATGSVSLAQLSSFPHICPQRNSLAQRSPAQPTSAHTLVSFVSFHRFHILVPCHPSTPSFSAGQAYLLREGLCWVDKKAPDGKPVFYFPSFVPGLTLSTA
jgi:hypothetical protein